MIVIADSTILINLAKIEGFFILKKLFGEIIISPSVYDEVVKFGKGRPGASETKEAEWIKVKNVKDKDRILLLISELDWAEAESIVLAQELKAHLLLIDEVKGRTIAKLARLKVKGTLGILAEAHRQKLIPDLKESLDILIKRGTYISPELYQGLLKQIKPVRKVKRDK